MKTLRLVALLACLALPGALAACDGSSPAMDVLAWDSAPDAGGGDTGRDLHGGPDANRDVAPWDPGVEAWPSDVVEDAMDAPADESPLDLSWVDAPDEGRPDSTVTDTPVDTPFVDAPKDAPADAPPDVKPDVAPGTLTCPEILQCARSCQYQFACVQECIDQGTPEAREIAQALLQCTMAFCQESLGNEGALQACVIEYCPDQGQACIGQCQPSCAGRECGGDGCGGDCGPCGEQQVCDNGTCVTGQALTCLGIVECSLECTGADFACLQDCRDQGSPAAQEVFSALFSCILAECSQSIQDPSQLEACAQDQCPDAYTACVEN